MRFLFALAARPDYDSGASGTLLSIGDALTRSGHEARFSWQPRRQPLIRPPIAEALLVQPWDQVMQISTALDQSAADVVILSQPFGWPVYRRLPQWFPNTLFLNRTHGWEARLAKVEQQFRSPGRLASSRLSQLSRELTRLACRETATRSHGVVTACTACSEFCVREYGLNRDSVGTIAYGLDESFLHPPPPRDGPGNRILFAGSYLRRKGTAVLERVLPPLASTGASLTFVVAPHQRTQVLSAYQPSFRDRLQVHSWLPRTELLDLYRAHDIFLFPSYFEGFGKTFLEAMSQGCCVVGFREGGLPDVAGTDGALVCEVGDAREFNHLLRTALREKELVRRVSSRAIARSQGYRWERCGAELIEFAQRRRAQLGMAHVE